MRRLYQLMTQFLAVNRAARGRRRAFFDSAKLVIAGALYGALLMGGAVQAADKAADASAEDNDLAEAWIERMNSAFAKLDYDGVFSFYTGDNLASLRVVHKLEDGLERERLVHLNGAPREIVRHGDKVICILQPGDRLVAMGGSIPAGPFARAFIRDFGMVSSSYNLSMKGEDRVAQRQAVRMLVEPKDEHRYGHRLWLDKETGLLLKSELFDIKRNKALEIFQFNQLAMGSDVNSAALDPEQPQGSVIDHLTVAENAPAKSESTNWHAGWLPAGFEMAASDLRHAPATQQDVNALIYSDGLAAISVFVETMPAASVGAESNMISHNGATVSVTQAVMGPNDAKHLVTVVGEVPAKTASAVAKSISYSN